jgi:hypothetical protein
MVVVCLWAEHTGALVAKTAHGLAAEFYRQVDVCESNGVEMGSFSIYSSRLVVEGATGTVASLLRHLVPTESPNIATTF